MVLHLVNRYIYLYLAIPIPHLDVHVISKKLSIIGFITVLSVLNVHPTLVTYSTSNETPDRHSILCDVKVRPVIKI